MKKFAAAVLALGLILGCSEKADYSNKSNNKGVETQSMQSETYDDFSFPDEIPVILFAAERAGVDPAYIMAIREAEKGAPGREYGIIPTPAYEKDDTVAGRPYKSELEKQAVWCAWTVKKKLEMYNSLPPEEKKKHKDFIDFLGDGYAPIGASNDPNNLNVNWERNVRYFYKKFKGD